MEPVAFCSELSFEKFIRQQISDLITNRKPHIYALESKKAVDILVCKDTETPELFFIEVKFHRPQHGRLGFGSGKGIGFQPEILTRQPAYFRRNLRWALASETHSPERIFFLNCEQVREFVAAGSIGQKFNNFQSRIWREADSLSQAEFGEALVAWIA